MLMKDGSSSTTAVSATLQAATDPARASGVDREFENIAVPAVSEPETTAATLSEVRGNVASGLVSGVSSVFSGVVSGLSSLNVNAVEKPLVSAVNSAKSRAERRATRAAGLSSEQLAGAGASFAAQKASTDLSL